MEEVLAGAILALLLFHGNPAAGPGQSPSAGLTDRRPAENMLTAYSKEAIIALGVS